MRSWSKVTSSSRLLLRESMWIDAACVCLRLVSRDVLPEAFPRFPSTLRFAWEDEAGIARGWLVVPDFWFGFGHQRSPLHRAIGQGPTRPTQKGSFSLWSVFCADLITLSIPSFLPRCEQELLHHQRRQHHRCPQIAN